MSLTFVLMLSLIAKKNVKRINENSEYIKNSRKLPRTQNYSRDFLGGKLITYGFIGSNSYLRTSSKRMKDIH